MTERGPLPDDDYRVTPDLADWALWSAEPVNHFRCDFQRWWIDEEDRLAHINPTWPTRPSGQAMHVNPTWPDSRGAAA